MATIKSFEDLDIWKKAQDLGALIYDLCEINKKIATDFSFKDQIKRAALSISNNIAEGFEYNNNNDFYRFLRFAKGSCGEVRNCLLFSIRVHYANIENIEDYLSLCKTLGSQIGSLMKYIKTKKLNVKKQSKINNSQPVIYNSLPATHNPPSQ